MVNRFLLLLGVHETKNASRCHKEKLLLSKLMAKSGHTGCGVTSITLAYADILLDRRASLQPILLVRDHFY